MEQVKRMVTAADPRFGNLSKIDSTALATAVRGLGVRVRTDLGAGPRVVGQLANAVPAALRGDHAGIR